jgi:hypothetical protein
MRALVHHSLILLVVPPLLENWVAYLMAYAKRGWQFNLLAAALDQISERFLFATVRGGLLDHGQIDTRTLHD